MTRKQPATEKVVFSYDRETKEYVGEYKCQTDPLESGKFLIPADATEIPPPTTHLFQKAIFENGKWLVTPDYRGRKVVILETQSILEIHKLGELPDNSVLLTIDDEYELNQGKHARVDTDGNLEFFMPPPTPAEQILTLERELTDTDWYVVRFAETGTVVPQEITERRAEIRKIISTLREEGV